MPATEAEKKTTLLLHVMRNKQIRKSPKNIDSRKKTKTNRIGWLVGWLVGRFYGMSTIVGLFNAEFRHFFFLGIIWFQVTIPSAEVVEYTDCISANR